MPWEIERITCSGSQCQRDVRIVESKSEAQQLVFDELPWRGTSHDTRLGKEELRVDCVERELSEQQLEFTENGVHYSYRLIHK